MSYKGSSWKKHKYVRKFNGRYYYSLDEYIQSHKNELKRDLKKDVQELKKNVNQSTKELDSYIKNIPDKKLNIEIPKMDLNKIKITPEMKKVYNEKFNEALKIVKDINDSITDKIIEGVKSFNKLIAKIF